jgi:hypothetical protein
MTGASITTLGDLPDPGPYNRPYGRCEFAACLFLLPDGHHWHIERRLYSWPPCMRRDLLNDPHHESRNLPLKRRLEMLRECEARS